MEKFEKSWERPWKVMEFENPERVQTLGGLMASVLDSKLNGLDSRTSCVLG